MSLGRNDPCPCGSGKKYKKCCLGKTGNAPESQISEAVEPRFFSPASSYYTQAALAEALKPGGVVRIHPSKHCAIRKETPIAGVTWGCSASTLGGMRTRKNTASS